MSDDRGVDWVEACSAGEGPLRGASCGAREVLEPFAYLAARRLVSSVVRSLLCRGPRRGTKTYAVPRSTERLGGGSANESLGQELVDGSSAPGERL